MKFSPLAHVQVINLAVYYTIAYAALGSYVSYHLKEIQREEHVMQFYFIFYST